MANGQRGGKEMDVKQTRKRPKMKLRRGADDRLGLDADETKTKEVGDKIRNHRRGGKA